MEIYSYPFEGMEMPWDGFERIQSLPPIERYQYRKRQFAALVNRFDNSVVIESFANQPYHPYNDDFLHPICEAIAYQVETYLEHDKQRLSDALANTLLSPEEFVDQKLAQLKESIESTREDELTRFVGWYLDKLKEGGYLSVHDDYHYLLKDGLWGRVIKEKVTGNCIDYEEYDKLFVIEKKRPETDKEFSDAAFYLMHFTADLKSFTATVANAISDFRFYYWLKAQTPSNLPQTLAAYLKADPKEGKRKLTLTRDELGFYLRWWLEVFTDGESQTAVADAFGEMLGLSKQKLRQAMSSNELTEEQKQKVRDFVKKHFEQLQ